MVDTLSLVEFAEIRVNSQLACCQSIWIRSQNFRQILKVRFMLLINEFSALQVRNPSALHSLADLFVLPDAFGSIVEYSALDNVATKL